MLKFAYGFFFAIVAMSAAAYIYEFQIFKDPLPLSGAQVKEIWRDTVKDSQSRWMLISKSDSAYILYLEYPVKRYKFSLSPEDIQIRVGNRALPMHVHSKDVSVAGDSEHSFADDFPE